MSKEASRIRRVIDRLKSREDIAEILKMAQLETVIAIFADDGKRFDRSLAIYEAAEDALEVASVRMQAPSVPGSCLRPSAATSDALS